MKVARDLSTVVAALSATVVISACGGAPAEGDQTNGDPQGARGDGSYYAPEIKPTPEIVIGHEGSYTAYNNHTSSPVNFGNTAVLNQVLTDPFVLDADLDYLLNADVMESAELTSENPQIVTYKIKPGIVWSDGRPWDCDDFYLSWLARSGKALPGGPGNQSFVGPPGVPQAFVTQVGTVGLERVTGRCQDDLTFIENYVTPSTDWQAHYVRNAILPAHILEQQLGIADITQITLHSGAELERVVNFWDTGWIGFTKHLMPGSGPYLIDGWQPNDSVTLVRNPRWAGNPGGPERLELRTVTDPAAQAQGLENHDFDVIVPRADPVVAERLRDLASRGLVFRVRPGPAFEHLDLNLAHPLFQDKAVRQALAQCIDRFDLVDKLVRGVDPEAAPLGSLVLRPDQPDYEDSYSAKMPAHAETAQRTLEGAGWTLGPDGVYVKDGQRLSFRISHADLALENQAVQLIQSHCRAAGMEIHDDTDQSFLDERLSRGEYEAALFAWNGSPQPSSLASVYRTGGRHNYQGYSNPRVDHAWSTVAVEFDEEIRSDVLRTIDGLIAEDYVSLPLFEVPIMWAYSDRIDNISYQDYAGITWNANEWEISS